MIPAPRAVQRLGDRLLRRGSRSLEARWQSGNAVRLLEDGREAFPAMLEAIAAAERQVLVEMYWFASDATGRTFAAALTDAARRGVRVGVVYDAWGSFGAGADRFDALTAAGGTVLEFNPVAPWRRRLGVEALARRDHRKILVVDRAVGFVGGINLGDPWADPTHGGGGWRDDAVRVEGPVVADLARLTEETWHRLGGLPFPPCPACDVRPERQDVQILAGDYQRRQRAIWVTYLSRLRGAARRIWVRNAYFAPDRRVLRALERAARRGVDVRLLLPGESDVPMVKFASRAVYGRLLEAGVRIYELLDAILHAKSALVDDWATVGSFNLDHLSLRINLEANVAVEHPAFAAEMERSFERDLLRSGEVDAREHRYRPLGERLLERLCWSLRRFL